MTAAVTVAEVQRLEGELQQCVETLQFEKAATLRDRIKALKAELAAMEVEVRRLEAQLQRHVSALEFEAAAQLRDRIRALRDPQGSSPPTAVPGSNPGKNGQQQVRTVCVTKLPLTTVFDDLKLQFPTAEHIKLHTGKIHAYAFITFPTTDEANDTAAAGLLQIGGKMVYVSLSGDCEAGVRRKEEEDRRTVLLAKLPLGASPTQLERRFPTAVSINVIPGKYHALAFVTLPCEEEAQRVAAQSEVQFDGCTVFVSMAGDKNASKRRISEITSRTVSFSCLPLTFQLSEVAERFPEADGFRMVQGKFYATAFACFPSVTAARKVASMSRVEFASGTAVVFTADDKEAREKNKSEQDRRTVFVTDLPPTISQAALEERFPGAEFVRLHSKGSRPSFAFICFPTVEEAVDLVKNGRVEIAGQFIFVSIAGERRDEEGCTLFLSNLPVGVSETELQQRLPTAVRIAVRRRETHAFAFVTFAMAEEALALAQLAEIEVAGTAVDVRIADSHDNRKSQKRPPEESRTERKHKKL
eukprot:EG_transcript_7712